MKKSKKLKKKQKTILLSRKTMREVTRFGNQTKLAKLIGVSQAYVSKMKRTGQLTSYLHEHGHQRKVERLAAAG